MLFRRQVNVSFCKPALVLTMAITTFIFSCVSPKKGEYPLNKPFVFKTIIKADANLPKDEKSDLELKLSNQLDDSLRTRTITAFRWKPPFVYRKLVAPSVFDSVNVARSNNFMIALLNSIGYYNPVVRDTIKIDTVTHHRHNPKKTRHEYRSTITFKIIPGKLIKMDSIGYDLQTPELQALALQNQKKSFLKKGKPFSKQIVSSELERLITLFRNNGYYKFSIKDIYAERDTVLSALIDPTLDPLQQAQLLDELKKKRENPTINVVIKQRPPQDSSELQKYYIDSVTVFSDLPLIEDTSMNIKNDTVSKNKISIIERSDKFKQSVIFKNLYLLPGNLYKLDDYYKTLNIFGNQLGAWQRATLDYSESPASDSLLNATIRLYPAKKQNIGAELEASYNTNDILTATNLFGIGANISLRNRNAYKRSIQTNTSVHGGVELGADFIQTTQASVSHTIAFPQSPSFGWFKKADTRNTAVNLIGAYTDRRDFFTLRTLEGSFGYEWTAGNKSFILRPVNIEYNLLTPTDSLNRLLDTVPSLKLAFKTGLVVSTQFIYNSTNQYGQNGKHTDFLRITVEPSGGLLGLIDKLNYGDLLRFIKGDLEYRHHIDSKNKKSELAFRAYIGAGLKYGAGKGTDQTLPIYKAFFSGGPNSMRGWQVRQLGLGSSIFYDTGIYARFDRFGDFKLEGNIEYRFPLGNIFGIKLRSAVYTDIGNIWNWTIPSDDSPEEKELLKNSNFAFNRFYKEFAVDIGTGLRFDFDYFIIRFDWAYKIKDPQRLEYPEKWFYDMQLKDGQFQLGIGYPF